MRIPSLVSLCALALSLAGCSDKTDDEKKPVQDSKTNEAGWATTVCESAGACIDITRSEFPDDPVCSKFKSEKPDVKTVTKTTCADSCVGRCVNIDGKYYAYTEYYYAPNFTVQSAQEACSKSEPTGGKAGSFVPGCK